MAWWWCRPRKAAEIAQASQAREDKEAATRARLAAGELGLDIYDMRDKLEAAGLVYYDDAGRREVSRASQQELFATGSESGEAEDRSCRRAPATRTATCSARRSKFPYAADRSYTPPDAPVEQLRKLHAHLGISRAVIVHASCHGSEMDVTLDAIASSGDTVPRRGRGAKMRSPIASCERLHDGGIRGIRFNFVKHLGGVPDLQVFYRAAGAHQAPGLAHRAALRCRRSARAARRCSRASTCRSSSITWDA